MSIKYNLSFFLIYLCFFANIQAQDKTFKLIQNFEVGKTYTYSTEKKETDSENPMKAQMTGLTNISFEVEGKKNNLKECILQYDTTKLEGMDMSMFPERMKKMFYLNTEHQTHLLIDENGAIKNVANLEECKQFVKKAISFVANLDIMQASEEEKAQIEQLVTQTSSTPELFVSNYLKEARILLYYTGYDISRENSTTLTIDTDSPFEGASIPSEVILEVENLENNTVKISATQSIKPEDIKKSFQKYMQSMGMDYALEEVPEIKTQISGYYIYDLEKQLIIESFTKIINEMDEAKQTESYKIKLLEVK